MTAAQADLDFAVSIARRAGDLTQQHFLQPDLAVDHKGDGSPVTVADRAAERLLREAIGAAYPDDAILGEEEGLAEGTSGRTWILDPIDGTKSFTHGVPLYTNLVALLDDDGPAIGVINVPALGECVWAGRELGCFHSTNATGLDGRRVDLAQPAMAVAGTWLMTSGLRVWRGEVIDRLSAAGVHMRTWADAYGYLLVATGRVDAMVDPIANLWDLAAPYVVVTEAGGRFTDLAGADRAEGGNGIATAGPVHDALRVLVADALPAELAPDMPGTG